MISRYEKMIKYGEQYKLSAFQTFLTENKASFEGAVASWDDAKFKDALKALRTAVTFNQVEYALSRFSLAHANGKVIESMKTSHRSALLAVAKTAPNALDAHHLQHLSQGLSANKGMSTFKRRLELILAETNRMQVADLERSKLEQYEKFTYDLQCQLQLFIHHASGEQQQLKAVAEALLNDKIFSKIEANIKALNEREKLLERGYVRTNATPRKIVAKSSEVKAEAEQWVHAYLAGQYDDLAKVKSLGDLTLGNDTPSTEDAAYTFIPVAIDKRLRAAVLRKREGDHVSADFYFDPQYTQSDEYYIPANYQWLPDKAKQLLVGSNEPTWLPNKLRKMTGGFLNQTFDYPLMAWAHASIKSLHFGMKNRDVPLYLHLEKMPKIAAQALVLYCEAMDIPYQAFGIYDWKPSSSEIKAVRKQFANDELTHTEEETLNKAAVLSPSPELPESDEEIQFSIPSPGIAG